MAYVAPIDCPKLINAASVNNAAYSDPAIVPLKSASLPVVFYVNCTQAHDLEFGTCAQSTTTAAELDVDTSYTKTTVAATATYGTRKYTVYPDAKGYMWCRVKNVSGGAAADVNVYGGQPS